MDAEEPFWIYAGHHAVNRGILLLVLAIAAVLTLSYVFRYDSHYYLAKDYGQTTRVEHGGMTVTIELGRWPDVERDAAEPQPLPPNTKANGFGIVWKFRGQAAGTLAVKDIRAVLVISEEESIETTIPVMNGPGTGGLPENEYFAFILPDLGEDGLRVGWYQIHLTYTIDGTPYDDLFEVEYAVDHRTGFHLPFLSMLRIPQATTTGHNGSPGIDHHSGGGQAAPAEIQTDVVFVRHIRLSARYPDREYG